MPYHVGYILKDKSNEPFVKLLTDEHHDPVVFHARVDAEAVCCKQQNYTIIEFASPPTVIYRTNWFGWFFLVAAIAVAMILKTTPLQVP